MLEPAEAAYSGGECGECGECGEIGGFGGFVAMKSSASSFGALRPRCPVCPTCLHCLASPGSTRALQVQTTRAISVRPKLLADTEAPKNGSQQVVRAEFPRDRTQLRLSQAELLGE